jgi:hypothetical protein
MHHQLSLDQRYTIHRMLKEAKSMAEIARAIGVHRSTVKRELDRNSENGVYNGQMAHIYARVRKTQAAKESVDPPRCPEFWLPKCLRKKRKSRPMVRKNRLKLAQRRLNYKYVYVPYFRFKRAPEYGRSRIGRRYNHRWKRFYHRRPYRFRSYWESYKRLKFLREWFPDLYPYYNLRSNRRRDHRKEYCRRKALQFLWNLRYQRYLKELNEKTIKERQAKQEDENQQLEAKELPVLKVTKEIKESVSLLFAPGFSLLLSFYNKSIEPRGKSPPFQKKIVQCFLADVMFLTKKSIFYLRYPQNYKISNRMS